MARSWPLTPLREILNPVRRKNKVEPISEYDLLGIRLDGGGPFLREVKLGSEISATTLYQVKDGDFIYSRLFAWRGAFGVIETALDGSFVSNEFPTFVPIKERLDVKFLNYWFSLKSVLKSVGDSCSGSTPLTRNRYKEEYFLRLGIPLPPISEQRRIVAKIERLAAKIEEAKGFRKKSDLKADIFLDAALLQILKDEKDETWVDGCIGDFVIDDCYGTSEKTHAEPIGVPILRMGNIQNGTLDIKDLKYLQVSKKDIQKLILHPKDILVNRTNSAELVGKCAVFNLEGEWGFASYIIRLRFDTKKANPYLVARYINSSLGRDYMFRERKQMTGQANVNAKKLKALPIQLPSIPHQNRIVDYINSLQAKVERLKALQVKTDAELNALLPSILDKAFKGEL